MNTKDLVSHIHDIRGLIGECYEDKEPLTKDQKDSKEVFIRYCNEIETTLNKLTEFTRIVLTKGIDAPLIKEYPDITYVDYNMKSRFALGNYTQVEFDLVKKVVKEYDKERKNN